MIGATVSLALFIPGAGYAQASQSQIVRAQG